MHGECRLRTRVSMQLQPLVAPFTPSSAIAVVQNGEISIHLRLAPEILLVPYVVDNDNSLAGSSTNLSVDKSGKFGERSAGRRRSDRTPA